MASLRRRTSAFFVRGKFAGVTPKAAQTYTDISKLTEEQNTQRLMLCFARERTQLYSDGGDAYSAEDAAASEVPEGRGVAELLLPQYALLTGGRSHDGCPIITFPDYSNFHILTSHEYQRLLLYLTSVPSLQEVDMGFHLVIDRRKDRWNSVKTVLMRISEYFPGVIHAAYVLRPAGFLQKALSEVSSKLFKEEFKFKVIVCSTLDEVYDYIDKSQLTSDLGGSLQYSHSIWIQQRIALEKFSALMREVSSHLDVFMQEIMDCDLGNDPEQTKSLLESQQNRYTNLKEEISTASGNGEQLLKEMKAQSSPDGTVGHVAAVERLLVQLDETERQFDEFWDRHSAKLNHWLCFRIFLLNFKELQASLDVYLKTACDMTEVGETACRVEELIKEINNFENLCIADLDHTEEVIKAGEDLMENPLSSIDSIQSKCDELKRSRNLLNDKIQKRQHLLTKARDLMDRVDKANQWCTSGVELLSSQNGLPAQAASELIALEAFVQAAHSFGLTSPQEFRETLIKSATQETKAIVTQVLQRVDDVWLMCSAKRTTLQKATAKLQRPVQQVTPQIPEVGIPSQPGTPPSRYKVRFVY